jgi:hypothetical protein
MYDLKHTFCTTDMVYVAWQFHNILAKTLRKERELALVVP